VNFTGCWNLTEAAAEYIAQKHPSISVVIQERWNEDEWGWDYV
jgi:phenylpyruvate tautomerase PptA (4-oxalocrotonate tautomerase family)